MRGEEMWSRIIEERGAESVCTGGSKLDAGWLG